GGIGFAAVPAMSMPTSEHTLLTHLPLVAPEVKRTVGLIRRRGRIQSYIAAELEKQITEQYRRT
ncbi:MAG TPA: LysR family transcriptional regulator, partial [Enterobacter asburiae]|nr:LysR family transcriptional regulator [Enterobacter asburiae]